MEHGPNKNLLVRSAVVAGTTLALAGFSTYTALSAARAQEAAQSQRNSGERGALLKDGTFTGAARSFGGVMHVSVVVSNGYITSIEVTGTGDNSPYFDRAKEKVIPAIVDRQSVSVDTVSGATFSSKGIMNAINNALVSAGAMEGQTARTNLTTSSSSKSHSTAELKRLAQQRAPEAPPWWEVTVDDLLGANDDGTGGYNYTIRQGSGGTN